MFGLPLWSMWLILCGLLLLIEIFNASFLLIWPGIGAFFAFIACILGAPVELQIAVFAISTTLMIIFMKPLVQKFFKNSDTTQMNKDALIGKKGIIVKAIDPQNEMGQVKVAGELWSAITTDKDEIKVDEAVKVVKVEGVKLIVTKDI